jgi:hypothetical protein
VKARIWKDRATGRWCYEVAAPGLAVGDDSITWAGALAGALADMSWLREHGLIWPAALLPLGWRHRQ